MIQLNELIYRDSVTKGYMYQWNVSQHSGASPKPEPKFQYIVNEDNVRIDDVDVATFEDCGTFWIDKKYVYFLDAKADDLKVTAHERRSFTNTCLFGNSHYRIIDGVLKYFGSPCLGGGYDDCSHSIIGTKIELSKFNVLDLGDFDEGYNEFAVYDGEIYRHGYKVKKIYPTVKKEVEKALAGSTFSQRYFMGQGVRNTVK